MTTATDNNSNNVGKIEGLFIAKESAAPMESLNEVTLQAGVGIQGDRYAMKQGTYSANFLSEPGRQVTIASADGLEEALTKSGMDPLPMTALRRNVVIRGFNAQILNDMVGHEIRLGSSCRLFVHRRNVPCRYREAETKRPNFMNKCWEACGICCEILEGGPVRLGDEIAVIPETHQPKRCKVGLKPPGFFKKPADRSLKEVRGAIIPIPLAILFSLLDPVGFERVESGYDSVGQHFFSPRAYNAGRFVKNYIRTPLLVGILGAGAAWAVGRVAFSRK